MATQTNAFSAEIRRFLDADPPRFATIATLSEDGSPHQAVVWYVTTDDGVVINSLEGRAWPTNLRRDPRLSFVVEDGYEYVALRGKVELIADQDRAQADIAAMCRRHHTPEHAEDMIERLFRPQQRVSFVLRPESVSTHGQIG
ncbi:hypothetical protein BH20CHL6_BH20CHL6_18800 [soil metagenome]